MSGFQQFIALGRLGNDPETKYTQGGTAVTTFSLATSRKRKDRDGNEREETQWHRCKAFDKKAEVIAEHVRKGDQLFVEGRVEYWQVEKDGVKRSGADVIVEHFEFCGGRRDHGEDRKPARSTSARERAREQVHGQQAAGVGEPFTEPFDDDIPF